MYIDYWQKLKMSILDLQCDFHMRRLSINDLLDSTKIYRFEMMSKIVCRWMIVAQFQIYPFVRLL